MNFKRHKPHDEKMMEWGTPKYVQIEEEKQTHSMPSGKWKKLYPCRKLKGEHTFVLKKKYDPWEYNGKIEVSSVWKCTACGKEDFRTEKIVKP
jgi:hypothetical protein